MLKSIKFLLIIAMLQVAATMLSAEVSFTVDYPHQVVQGNKFRITFSLRNAEGAGCTAPEVGGCAT